MLQRFFKKEKNSNKKSGELKTYLSEDRIEHTNDILQWWKGKKSEFPILSLVARDYLASQSTSVPSERAFSSSGQIISDTRTRLHKETVRELMCVQSWRKSGII